MAERCDSNCEDLQYMGCLAYWCDKHGTHLEQEEIYYPLKCEECVNDACFMDFNERD